MVPLIRGIPNESESCNNECSCESVAVVVDCTDAVFGLFDVSAGVPRVVVTDEVVTEVWGSVLT